ncbi:hypothetical protein HMPREF6745_1966 [Prevotella sp. oral taxon 472 str. F0295]|nr:hypothetical protein HMPREF6745_1966 [Prevotella sp. oral taxon 472 str. F0295]
MRTGKNNKTSLKTTCNHYNAELKTGRASTANAPTLHASANKHQGQTF